MATPCTCVICGMPFEARTSYGLCPFCVSRDRLREFDRLEKEKHRAELVHLNVTLTLVQWLSVINDFRNLCAYCQKYSFAEMSMVDPIQGLTYENVVPTCRACEVHKKRGFHSSLERVKEYLDGPRIAELYLLEVDEVSV